METNSKVRLWESYRADARRIDGDAEQQLAALEGLAHSCDAANAGRFEKAHSQAVSTIAQLHSTVTSMSDVSSALRQAGFTTAAAAAGAASPGGAPEASLDMAAIAKHTLRLEDIVQDKTTTLRRLKIEASRRKERAELMSRVHTEISVYEESSEMRHLAGEQESLRHTQRRAQELIEEAQANRARLHSQRAMFTNIGDKAVGVAEQIPVVKDLLKKIDAKRRREAVILGIVMALCLILVFVFW